MTGVIGNTLEAAVIYLLKQAGVKVVAVQKRGKANIAGYDIPGTLDLIIELDDGRTGVVDIKTCSSYAWQSKWRDAYTLAEKDNYGYIEQALCYAKAENLPFLGWIVINKDGTGDLENFVRWISADDITPIITAKEESIAKKLAALESDTLPPQCYPVVYETYSPKNEASFETGNIKADIECSRCPFVDKCFPDAKVARRGRTMIHYIGEVKYLIPGVRLEKEDK